jgi:hypothetical protein
MHALIIDALRNVRVDVTYVSGPHISTLDVAFITNSKYTIYPNRVFGAPYTPFLLLDWPGSASLYIQVARLGKTD